MMVRLLLVMSFVTTLVMFVLLLLLRDNRNRIVVLSAAHLVVRSDPLQTRCMRQKLALVGSFLAQITDELMGAIIEFIEAITLLQIHTPTGVASDAM